MWRSSHTLEFSLTALFCGVCCLAFLAVSTSADGGGANDPSKQDGTRDRSDNQHETLDYLAGELVVGLQPQASASSMLNWEEVYSVEASLGHSNTYLVKLAAGEEPESAGFSLVKLPGVSFAHPNYVLDPLHPVQGSFPFSDEKQVGTFDGQRAALMTNLSAASSIATGNQVTVGVIDCGIDFTHAAMDSKATSGWDFVDEDGDAFDVGGGDVSGHGTFVSGLIHLVAPDAEVVSYRVMDEYGRGDGFTLARAIERAVDDGCDVINLSVVLTARHLAVRNALEYAASRGVIVVAAAGNNGADAPVYPAAEANVLSVAAIDSVFQPAEFSNFSSEVDVCAPGVNVYSAYRDDLFAWWSGTSFAAPFVAGQAALLREIYPTMLVPQIENLIETTAMPLDSLSPVNLGSGMILPAASLTATPSGDSAIVIPDTVSFVHYEGVINVIAPQIGIMVLSSIPTATYTAQVTNSSGVFTYVIPETGPVNDTVMIVINPYDLPVGEYENVVQFDVDGVATPAYLVVQLSVVPQVQMNDAYFVPSYLYFSATATTEPLISRSSLLRSTNAPANFTAQVLPGLYGFTSLVTTGGVTDDSVKVVVDPSLVPGAGIYSDTVICYVEGVSEPAKLPVLLEIGDTIVGGDHEFAYLSPQEQTFVISSDTSYATSGQIAITADGATKWWAAAVADAPDFLVLSDTTGQTGEPLLFTVAIPEQLALLAPGIYSDTVIVWVGDVVNSPLRGVVNLVVNGPGGDTVQTPNATAFPDNWDFVIAPGAESFSFVTTLISSNAPAPYQVVTSGPSNFLTIHNTSGYTNDSVHFTIDPSAFVPGGWYCDSIWFDVQGVPYSLLQTICVLVDTLGDTSGTTNPVQLSPDELSFWIEEGSTMSQTACAVLFIPFENPLPFTGYVAGGSSFLTLLTPSGLMPDSVCVAVDPTGLAIGTYSDTAVFRIDGYADTALLPVHMTITGPDTVVSDTMPKLSQNYPNPFNPTTSISFVLSQPEQVRIDVYNIAGQRVTTLLDEFLPRGEHTVQWDAAGLPSGVYLYRLTTESVTESRKMLLLK